MANGGIGALPKLLGVHAPHMGLPIALSMFKILNMHYLIPLETVGDGVFLVRGAGTGGAAAGAVAPNFHAGGSAPPSFYRCIGCYINVQC